MLKKLLLALTLFAVMPAVCMEYVIRVPKTTIKITTQDGQEFVVDKEQAKCSETLKSLIVGDADDDVDSEAFKDGIPLPNVTGPTWAKIQALLPLLVEKKVLDKKEEKTAADRQRIKEIEEEMKVLILSYDGATLIDFISAMNYLDIPILLNLAIDVAKKMGTEKFREIAFEQIATLPKQIWNPIIFGQMIRVLGLVPDKQLAVCDGHTGSVTSVCITHDNKIVSGSCDGTVRVWDMQGNQLAQCNGHTDWVKVVYVTPDNMIVSGSNDRTVRVWDIHGKQLAQCDGHTGSVTAVCITHDNKIVSGSCDGTVRVWDMQGNQFAQCNGHVYSVSSVCVTHDNKIVSGGCDDHTVRIWDMRGNQLAQCNGHTGRAISVCVTSDNKIVSSSNDGTVHVWDMLGNQLECNGHIDAVNALCVTHGNKIVSGSYDGTVCIWDISLSNRISSMDSEQAQGICQYLQSDRAKNWDHIPAILDGKNIDEQESFTQPLEGPADAVIAGNEPVNWVTRTATVLGAGAVIGVLGWCAYKWFANNSNE